MIVYVICAFVGLIIRNINYLKFHERNNFRIIFAVFIRQYSSLPVASPQHFMMFPMDCIGDILYYSISLNSHRMCGRILCEEFLREDLAYFRTNFPAGINVDYGGCLLGTHNPQPLYRIFWSKFCKQRYKN